jgi:hypothetical protein
MQQHETMEIWHCSKCGQMLGVITVHEIVITSHGQPIITDGSVKRPCNKCKTDNTATPIDKRASLS